MVTPAVKREAVAHLRQAHEMSERRACRVIGCIRMTVRYRSIDLAGSTMRVCANGRTVADIGQGPAALGHRRLHVLLRREGFVVNHKRLYRIYRKRRRHRHGGGKSPD